MDKKFKRFILQDIGRTAADNYAVLSLRKGQDDLSLEIIEHIVHWYKREIICKLQLTVNGKYPLTGFFLVYLCQGVEGDIVFLGSHVDQFFIIKTDVQVFSQSLADKASVASKHTIDGDNTFCHKDTSFISDRKQEYLISGSFSYFFYNIFQ